ncbi:MAG TPA: Ig-like domain-containing protein, partial [Candidatus Saccharimonadales bacterium]|nr:Ig-like domain-containing protein [Candidatus Saccharimonadales bacterium]
MVTVIMTLAGSSLTTPKTAGDLVLEYHTPHLHLDYPDKLQEYIPHSKLLLYGDGRLICGSEQTQTATKHTTAKLTSAQVADIVSRLNDTGLRQLKDTYSQDPYELPALETGITLNLTSGAKKVAHYSGPKPAAFDRSIQILQEACAQATEPYQPATVQVKVMKQAGPAAATPRAPEVLAPAFDSLPAKRASRQVSGQTAKNLIEKFAGQSKTRLAEDGAIYEAALYPQLPDYRLPDIKQTQAKADTVHAASQNPIQYYWFYASSNSRHGNAGQIHSIARGTNDWYNRQTGRQVILNNSGEIKGANDENWYKTCRRQGGCDIFGPDLRALMAMYDNLHKLYYQAGRSTNMLVQFSAGAYCGGLGGGDNPGGFAMNHNMAHPDCIGIAQGLSAHEQGHSMGIARTADKHRTDGTVMGNCEGGFPNCRLNADDANYLRAGTYFTSTAPPPADTTRPSTAVTAPTNGARVSGSTTVSATATDNVRVAKVDFLVDGVLKATDSTSPYSFVWDTKTASNGSRSLTTKAYDAAGNTTTSTAITVTVANTTATTPPPPPPSTSRVPVCAYYSQTD